MENKDKKTFVFRVTRTATSCWAEFTVFFFLRFYYGDSILLTPTDCMYFFIPFLFDNASLFF